MARLSIRDYIDIVEGKQPQARQPWGVSMTNIFAPSLAEHRRVFPDLDEKLAKFIGLKTPDPITARYGKHDRPFTGPLVGFWHCHLRDDAILIYNLQNHAINLVAICSHSEIEGKRAQKMSKRLNSYK